jgi:hypothetical protein
MISGIQVKGDQGGRQDRAAAVGNGKWQMASLSVFIWIRSSVHLGPSVPKPSHYGLGRVICSLHISIFDLQFLYECDGASFPTAAAPGD